jgi:hypothetical protein
MNNSTIDLKCSESLKELLNKYKDNEYMSQRIYNHIVNYLPNTDTPPQNFPVSNINQLVDTVQQYPNPNVATDKYFNQNNYEERANKGLPIGQNPQQIYSMSGNYLESQQFKHNNMVPFNGGKVKGNTYNVNMSESILDNMIGNGSQVIKKVEQAPLFKPEDNVQWAYGAPNQSDFYQSRVKWCKGFY